MMRMNYPEPLEPYSTSGGESSHPDPAAKPPDGPQSRPRRPSREIASKRILLTGASGGIGGAVAHALVAKGATVVLAGRNERILNDRARDLGADVVVGDVTDARGFAALRAAARSCDVVIHNAADPGEGQFADCAPGDVTRVLDTNLVGPMRLTQAYLHDRREARDGGGIIFIGSVAGVAPSPGLSLYNASKFGLRGFALSLHAELRASDCWATHIAPGFISDVGMFAASGKPLPRWVRSRRADDVARAVQRALTRQPAEIWVAPLELRVAARVVSRAPGLTAAVRRNR